MHVCVYARIKVTERLLYIKATRYDSHHVVCPSITQTIMKEQVGWLVPNTLQLCIGNVDTPAQNIQELIRYWSLLSTDPRTTYGLNPLGS